MRILADTSALVELERGSRKAAAIMQKLSKHTFCISTITVSEMLIGAFLSKKTSAQANASSLLNQFIFIDIDASAAGAAAAMKAKSQSALGWADNIIAATVITGQCDLLLTENKKHFSDIPELKGKVKSFSDL